MAREVWLKDYMHVVDAVVLVLALLVAVPIPRRPNARTASILVATALALLGTVVLLVWAGAYVTTATPDVSLAAVDWRYDSAAPQWGVQYGLFAFASVLLPLVSRLRFTRGVAWAWPLLPAGLAVAALASALVMWVTA